MKRVVALMMYAGMVVTGSGHAASLSQADISYSTEPGEGSAIEPEPGELAQAREGHARVTKLPGHALQAATRHKQQADTLQALPT
jgi:hypothetical protein